MTSGMKFDEAALHQLSESVEDAARLPGAGDNAIEILANMTPEDALIALYNRTIDLPVSQPRVKDISDGDGTNMIKVTLLFQ
jgi:hypothetical protein